MYYSASVGGKHRCAGGMKRSRQNCLPMFKTHDTLLYFPLKFASCLNSGDFGSLHKFIQTRASASCEFYIANIRLSRAGLIASLELLNEIYPDGIFTVYRNKVSEDSIVSEAFYNCTDNKTIRSALVSQLPCPSLIAGLGGPRAEPARLTKYLEGRPLEECERLREQILTEEDMVVRGKVELTITFDPLSKRVTRMRINYEFASLSVV